VPASPGPRGLAPALAALFVLSFTLRALGLGAQALIGDDRMVFETARNFVELGWPEPTMWNHPRLRDLLVHVSLGLLGDGPWGLKAWSVLLGALSAPAIALLVWRLCANLPAALIAGGVVATDPLHLDFSRQGINDVYLAAIPVAAILALVRYRDAREPAALALAGILTGLGAAAKWSAVFPVGAAGLVVLGLVAREEQTWRGRLAEVALFASCLVAIPVAVYVLTYWPWFSRGHGLGEFLRFQGAMAQETATHVGYPGTKLPGYPGEVVQAWRWFVQPIWFVDYLPHAPGREGGAPVGFLAGVANPLTWLATLPAAAWAVRRWLRERDGAAGWLLLLFAAAYVPFVVVPRPIWTNSALAALPFGAALVGLAAAELRRRHRIPVALWGAAALIVAALLWPAAMGRSNPVTDATVRALVSPLAFERPDHGGPSRTGPVAP
jgi:4-amino-4-deoxy-L-arabinose transferase-like glycosyltransferase